MRNILSPKLTLVSPIPSFPAPSSLLLLGAALISASSLPGAEVSTALPLQNAGPTAKTLFTAPSPEESGIDFINPIDTTHPLKRIYLGAFACGGIGAGDLNGDGRPELAFAVNNSPTMFFSELPVSDQSNKLLEVRLRGKPGNLVSVGARITLSSPTISQTQISEITAGSGYLGQSEAARWFGLEPDPPESPVSVIVRWPDGSSSTTRALAGIGKVIIQQP